MTPPEIASLNAVKTLLRERGEEKLYPCIKDLIENGLDLARFKPDEYPPNRQDITQYLAAWSRHAGLTAEESSGWMMDYCTTTLAVLSRRTPAAIRHSTKGNLRYIYGSEVPFLCELADNRFRAHCSPDCPVYAEMQAKILAKANEPPRSFIPRPLPPIEPYVPKKKANREQFETALRLVGEELEKDTKTKKILELLDERGLKTRTGRKWTYSILTSEIAKSRAAKTGLKGEDGPVTPDERGYS